ncbi:unnamed protein product [Nesidiocoris tenuis]|uniref:Uncharacterized protein n=1 Tax=Nesidiocoris tenuis TaxID=355587 RepID=A0A6H5FY03_9HEMI|nr:unnamed protein product [Nesidiocoris tenuis]
MGSSYRRKTNKLQKCRPYPDIQNPGPLQYLWVTSSNFIAISDLMRPQFEEGRHLLPQNGLDFHNLRSNRRKNQKSAKAAGFDGMGSQARSEGRDLENSANLSPFPSAEKLLQFMSKTAETFNISLIKFRQSCEYPRPKSPRGTFDIMFVEFELTHQTPRHTGFILMRHYPVRPRYVSATQLLFEIDEGFLLVMLMCFDFFFIEIQTFCINCATKCAQPNFHYLDFVEAPVYTRFVVNLYARAEAVPLYVCHSNLPCTRFMANGLAFLEADIQLSQLARQFVTNWLADSISGFLAI